MNRQRWERIWNVAGNLLVALGWWAILLYVAWGWLMTEH